MSNLNRNKKLGFIVNPLAGIGGRVGLKGSDGVEIVRRAKEKGAEIESPRRATESLRELTPIKERIEILTCSYEMGEAEARESSFDPVVIRSIKRGLTTAQDTKDAAKEMADLKADLILFAGGDGTARDICESIQNRVPVIGIPAGVKMHSAVFATNPRNAGELALLYFQGKITKVREAEVMDIDEEAFREGRVAAKLYGYLMVPQAEMLVQTLKSASLGGEEETLNSMAEYLIESMEQDCIYIIGPGTTTRGIMERLGLRKTLLGVDAICNKELMANDVDETQLLKLITNKKAKIVVTVIGGQGYIFGRGNQQISPRVIRELGKENIIVISSLGKLTALGGRPLLIDTGDNEVNNLLAGYYRVIVGYAREIMCKAE